MWRQIKAHRLQTRLHELLYLLCADVHVLGKFLCARFTPELLLQAEAAPFQPVELVAKVYRQTNGPSLIGKSTGDRLSNPPERVGTEPGC